MAATTHPLRRPSLATRVRPPVWALFVCVYELLLLAAVMPACAQVAASATLTSAYDYRGVTLTDGQPALGISVSYDQTSGAYLGASLFGHNPTHAGLQPLGELAYIGYAHRIETGPGLDLGVSEFRYKTYYTALSGNKLTPNRPYFFGNYVTDSTQSYIGLLGKNVSFYLNYSPNYFNDGIAALYSDLSGAIHPAPRWRLFAHAGILTPLSGRPEPGARREEYDLRAGIAAELKHAEVQLAWTTRRPNSDQLGAYRQGRDALTLSASWFF